MDEFDPDFTSFFCPWHEGSGVGLGDPAACLGHGRRGAAFEGTGWWKRYGTIYAIYILYHTCIYIYMYIQVHIYIYDLRYYFLLKDNSMY